MTALLSNSANSAVMSATSPMDVGKGATNYINSNGELMLYGVIGDWWEGNDALSVVQQLEHANPSGDLHVRIYSEGGNILEGLAIYNALKLSSRRVVVTIDGMALSIATVIALAGDEIRMPRNAFQFFHMAQNEVRGNAEDLKSAADTLDMFSSQAASIYSEHSNLSNEESLALMANNTWLNAEQCLDHGLIHTILDPVEAVNHHMEFGEKELPQGVFALMQLPITAAPAASTEEPLEEIPVKTAQMSAGQHSATPAATPAAGDNLVADPAAEAAMHEAGITAERGRQTELRTLATMHKVDGAVMEAWIKDGITIEAARTATLKLNEQTDKDNIPAGRAAVVTNDGRSQMSADVQAAILHRCAPGANAIEGNNEFAHMSLIDVSRQILMHNSVSTAGMSPHQIAAAVLHSTSDLPNIFADVANNELARGYQARQRSFTQIASRRNMRNFNTQNITRMSDAPGLLDKGQNGEYQLGHLKDSKETITLQTKGRIIRISREMIINDDMDAFSRLPMMMGAQGALNENRMVYGLLTDNKKMGEDDVALFHASHNNLITGAASFDVALLSQMRKLLRLQKSFAAKGETGYALNTPLGTVVVPAALETDAQKIVASIVAASAGNVNPFTGLNIIAEAELDSASSVASYGIGDPNLVDGLIYGYLEGEEGVYIDSQVDFKSDGLDLKVRHDFAASVADYRGLVKHAGA